MKLLSLLFSSAVYAAGSGHHGSPADLLPNAVNLTLLIIILAYFVGGQLVTYCKNKHKETKELLEAAATKEKEANQKLVAINAKLKESDAEVEQFKKNAQHAVSSFEERYELDTKARLEQLSVDAKNKIETLKSSLSNSVYAELVNKIVSDSKEKIDQDSGLSNESRKNLLGKLS